VDGAIDVDDDDDARLKRGLLLEGEDGDAVGESSVGVVGSVGDPKLLLLLFVLEDDDADLVEIGRLRFMAGFSSITREYNVGFFGKNLVLP